MIGIDVSHESEEMERTAPPEKVMHVLERVLGMVGKDDCELSCSFVSDGTMSNLNSSYRGKEGSTDILSFVQTDESNEFPFFREEGEPEVLGDIVISLDAMERNCEEFSVAADEELSRLLIHGVLHLTGWDHETNDVSEPMLVRQEALLEMLKKESFL